MSQKIIPTMSRALFDSDLVITRLLLGFSELLWAILLAWPGHTFDRPTYHFMAHVMSEEAWAFVFLFSGLTQIFIVGTEGFHGLFARYFAGWNAALWVFIVTSMLASVYPPPAAISGEIVLALAAVWIWVRPLIILRGIEYARANR